MATMMKTLQVVAAASCLGLTASTQTGFASAFANATARQAVGPSAAEVEVYRTTIEPLFMRGRGGTEPGFASCVMCHTWQTKLRFSLETPATPAGWTPEQSRRNFDVVTKLVNTASVEASRLLQKPLATSAGGLGHTGGTFWQSKDDPEYQMVMKWIRSLPPGRYVPAPEPVLDFTFFRSCVQQVFAKPREGHIRCSNCHSAAAGIMGFAVLPGNGREWSDAEAKQAFQTISRLIVPGNPEQSRFLLKPLHPDGGGSYAHNGVRRWQTRNDPEWQMLAAWVRGEKKGNACT